MSNIKVTVQDANNVLLEVTPVPIQQIAIDRGVAGRGVEDVTAIEIDNALYLEFTFTDGSTEIVGPVGTIQYIGQAPIVVTGSTISLSTVPVNLGGTGQTTANAAFNALAPSQTGNSGKYLTTDGSNTSWQANPLGTVTSVNMSVPTGLTIAGNPITTNGTLAVGLQSGYSIPTTASQTNWDTAYSERQQWDGGATNLVAATGRTSLGLGTIATQNSNAVSITGGSITGITDLAVADGGTGASTAADARTNLGAAASATTISAGTGLSGGGDLSANRTLSIANTGVTAAAYGSASNTLTATVNAQGQLSALAATPIAIANTQVSGLGTASTLNAGVALGVATLDAGGTVPLSQIPASIQGGVSYQGAWNASTNTPSLTSSVGTKGYYYVVSVAGNTNLNGVTDWLVGDWAIFNGSIWQKIDNTDSVASVNGYTGVVVLGASDVGAPPTSLTISTGTGLSGGGDLSANRTLSIADTAVTANSYGSASSVGTFTVNAQGQLTAASNTSIAIANTQVSGLGTMSTQNANDVIITGGSISGITDLAIADGGTGASTAGAALSNLGGIGTITSLDGSIVVLASGTSVDLAVSAASPASTLLAQVRNATGATLTKGTVVYISGATGQISTVSKAIASGDSTSAQTLGMITANLPNNTNGYVTVFGLITDINTSAYEDGDQLYLSGTVAGGVTTTKPSAPTHLVYIAVVEYAHPTQGKLLVKVQNGYELEELHDVAISSPVTGQTLTYNSTTDLWSNTTVSLTAGVNGTLPIANGGTGQTTATAAFNALAPSQTGNSGKYLTTDGTDTSWASNPLGTVTSVAASVPSFLSIDGSPITTSGTLAITLSGTALPTTSGGTGLTSFTANGVAYASSTSALATGSALQFDGTNLGVGVTPSAWASTWKVFQSLGGFVGSNSADGYRFANNSYSDGTNWRYVATGEASAYQQLDGSHAWSTAASGTAGDAISFTQAMTLDASGNLGIGTSSPTEKFTVQGAPTTYGDSRFNASLFDTTSATTGTGSGIAFSGWTNETGTGATFAQIKGIKENSTAGNVAGAFVISTQPASGTPTERVRINSSGNVGIGTPNPSSKLDVFSTENYSWAATITNNGSTNAHGLLAYTGPLSTGIPFAVYSASVERMRVSPAGDLGIGTSSPASQLDVSKTGDAIISLTSAGVQRYQLITRSGGNFEVYDQSSTASRLTLTQSGNLGLGITPSAWSLYKALQVNSTGVFSNVSGTTRVGDNFYYDGSSYRYLTNSYANMVQYNGGGGGFAWFNAPSGTAGDAISFTQAMTLDASGNLGIGTSSPAAKLDVTGGSSTGGFIVNGSIASVRASSTVVDIGDGNRIMALGPNTTTAGLFKFIVASSDASVYTTAATIDTSGNVGIGTSSPVGRLTLRGAAGTSGKNQGILLEYSNGTEYGALGLNNGSGWPQLMARAGAGITFHTNSDLQTTGEAMRLDSSGNLGIGTSSPASKLTVSNGTVTAGIQPYTPDGICYFGTSSNHGLAFLTNSAERMRLDTSGNLGLGVTPSAWSAIKAIQVGTAASFSGGGGFNDAFIASNAFYDGSNWKYINTNPAYYSSVGGTAAARWYTAPSGTADSAISFTQAMTLDASGNLGIGTSSPASKLDVNSTASRVVDITSSNASGAFLRLVNSATALGYLGSAKAIFGTNLADLALDVSGANNLIFGTNDTERARIDSSGNLLVGTTSNTYGGTGVIQNNAAIISGLATGSGYNNINSAALEGTSGRVIVNHSGTSDGSLYVGFAYNGSGIGSITQSGTTAVLYNTTSDQRLKENIADADSASALIDSLQVRQFDWKADGSHQRYGFVAQELATVYPEAVHQPQDTEQMMAVDYSKLVPLLVKEIQSLKARLDAANL